MSRITLVAAAFSTLLGGTAVTLPSAAMAAGGFQNTCSNIAFAYSASGQATLTATCLRANGSPNSTSLVLNGISNQNGNLVQGSGASTFQQSCGSIQVATSAQGANLTALCRNSGGGANATSVPLNINNNNGTLSY